MGMPKQLMKRPVIFTPLGHGEPTIDCRNLSAVKLRLQPDSRGYRAVDPAGGEPA
jgi:hypothetical protein